ncbi:MAG: hypothetical protein IJ068_07795 [Bacilli bacterium]|nr:hypothetical protein [Bacilli bacterium]
MNYYLMFHIDKSGSNGIVLKSSNDLLEMDNYIISNFQNNKDVIKKYENNIAEFCLDNIKTITEENARNNHNRLGAITLFGKYTNNYGTHVFKIPIIYKNDNKLLSNASCLKKIKEKLNDDSILRKLLRERSYLLSYNEINLINMYFKFNNERVKNEFIETFLNRLKNFNDDKKYFFFRALMNLCSLNKREIKIKKGTVSNINSIENNMRLQKEEKILIIKEDDDVDSYLMSLIEEKNYEELNKYYDLEKILKVTVLNKK